MTDPWDEVKQAVAASRDLSRHDAVIWAAATAPVVRKLWRDIRLQVWAIFCAFDDACDIPRIGSKRAKDD